MNNKINTVNNNFKEDIVRDFKESPFDKISEELIFIIFEKLKDLNSIAKTNKRFNILVKNKNLNSSYLIRLTNRLFEFYKNETNKYMSLSKLHTLFEEQKKAFLTMSELANNFYKTGKKYTIDVALLDDHEIICSLSKKYFGKYDKYNETNILFWIIQYVMKTKLDPEQLYKSLLALNNMNNRINTVDDNFKKSLFEKIPEELIFIIFEELKDLNSIARTNKRFNNLAIKFEVKKLDSNYLIRLTNKLFEFYKNETNKYMSIDKLNTLFKKQLKVLLFISKIANDKDTTSEHSPRSSYVNKIALLTHQGLYDIAFSLSKKYFNEDVAVHIVLSIIECAMIKKLDPKKVYESFSKYYPKGQKQLFRERIQSVIEDDGYDEEYSFVYPEVFPEFNKEFFKKL